MSVRHKSTNPVWIDPDDAPDLSAPEWRKKIDAAPIVRLRGRPRPAIEKVATNLRISADILDAYKATGPGWQTRIEAALWNSIEQLRQEKSMPSAREGDAVRRHVADKILKDLNDPDDHKRALDAMIARRKAALGR